ncbi:MULTISPECIES: VOC family protein [Methylomicrobium]|uniref:Lactoylglutathione lyase-like lyase n=1 Tax=Methylomicrobium album BG8 TaxID=686340 RepID=H8GPD3_METAL|nr:MULTISPECIES: VOC family protein [Methylomicrobium]EIC30879.1 lactoylglutathione lyase-like lyase [Methylomicrobium album BG8]
MAIFTHITVGTNDLERARAFYDQVLSALAYQRVADSETAAIWGESAPEFFVLKPADGQPASVGNGVTVSFAAPSRAAVDEFHKRALAAGGQDAGAPGPRSFAPNAYATYARDLDGHKIVAVCLQPA